MTATQDPETPRRVAPGIALPLAFGAAILASRIPAVLCDFEMNVDESQLIAQVRRYQLDLLPWRSVNGDTGGPLNTWFLLLAHGLGMPLGYAWAHALAALALAAAVVLTVCAAGRLFGRDGALIGGFLGTTWVVLHQITDFVQYSSELVPILLVAVALGLIGRSFRFDLLAALVVGMMPWAKLQVVPLGAAMAAWLVARTLWPGGSGAVRLPARLRRAALIILSACLPSALLLAAVARGGAWEDFRRAYFITNLSYAGDASLLPFLRRALDCTVLRGSMAPWCVGLLLAGFLVPWRRSLAARLSNWRGPGALALAILAAAVAAWARTPTEWAHYDFFLLPGLILATAAIIEPAESAPGGAGRMWACALALVAAYALVLGGPALDSGRHLLKRRSLPQQADGLLAAVRRLSPGFRTLAVWGWRPAVYVRGGITPPTRQANCAFLFIESPSRGFLRSRYASDLERSLPDIVLDSGGMSFEKYWHGVHALEAPEIAPVMRRHYALIGTIEAEDGTAYVYALKTP
jgi:hypothetical protein